MCTSLSVLCVEVAASPETCQREKRISLEQLFQAGRRHCWEAASLLFLWLCTQQQNVLAHPSCHSVHLGLQHYSQASPQGSGFSQKHLKEQMNGLKSDFRDLFTLPGPYSSMWNISMFRLHTQRKLKCTLHLPGKHLRVAHPEVLHNLYLMFFYMILLQMAWYQYKLCLNNFTVPTKAVVSLLHFSLMVSHLCSPFVHTTSTVKISKGHHSRYDLYFCKALDFILWFSSPPEEQLPACASTRGY